jgi:hypothetical protein
MSNLLTHICHYQTVPLHILLRHHRTASLLAGILLLPAGSVYAAQQLSDAELDRRYLDSEAPSLTITDDQIQAIDSAEAVFNKARVLLAQSAQAPDVAHVQQTITWQDTQLVNRNTGTHADSLNTFDQLVVSNLGSERYSYRWAGNLQDVVQIGRPLYLSTRLTGTDIELINFDSRQIGIDVTYNRF